VALLLVTAPIFATENFLAVILPAPILIGVVYPLLLWLRSLFCRHNVGSNHPGKSPPHTSPPPPLPSPRRSSLGELDEDVTVYLVSVARLCAALRTRQASDVLRELYSPGVGALISAVTVGALRSRSSFEDGADELGGVARRFALVSYRQEYDAADGTTMDAASLASIGHRLHRRGSGHRRPVVRCVDLCASLPSLPHTLQFRRTLSFSACASAQPAPPHPPFDRRAPPETHARSADSRCRQDRRCTVPSSALLCDARGGDDECR
jgi:hypothetical protein